MAGDKHLGRSSFNLAPTEPFSFFWNPFGRKLVIKNIWRNLLLWVSHYYSGFPNLPFPLLIFPLFYFLEDNLLHDIWEQICSAFDEHGAPAHDPLFTSSLWSLTVGISRGVAVWGLVVRSSCQLLDRELGIMCWVLVSSTISWGSSRQPAGLSWGWAAIWMLSSQSWAWPGGAAPLATRPSAL